MPSKNNDEEDDTVPENYNKTNIDCDVIHDNLDINREKNLFDQEMNEELEVTLQTTLNPKVLMSLRNLQASYSEDANKIIIQAKQVKVINEIQIFSLT